VEKINDLFIIIYLNICVAEPHQFDAATDPTPAPDWQNAAAAAPTPFPWLRF
jgi:hypothetical protein